MSLLILPVSPNFARGASLQRGRQTRQYRISISFASPRQEPLSSVETARSLDEQENVLDVAVILVYADDISIAGYITTSWRFYKTQTAAIIWHQRAVRIQQLRSQMIQQLRSQMIRQLQDQKIQLQLQLQKPAIQQSPRLKWGLKVNQCQILLKKDKHNI